jgi:hypothetical protein
LVSASVEVQRILLDRIEPFPTTDKLVPYSAGYVAGWTVERYLCSEEVPGDTHRNLEVEARYSLQTFKHFLASVWLLTYTYGARHGFQETLGGVDRQFQPYMTSTFQAANLSFAKVSVRPRNLDAAAVKEIQNGMYAAIAVAADVPLPASPAPMALTDLEASRFNQMMSSYLQMLIDRKVPEAKLGHLEVSLRCLASPASGGYVTNASLNASAEVLHGLVLALAMQTRTLSQVGERGLGQRRLTPGERDAVIYEKVQGALKRALEGDGAFSLNRKLINDLVEQIEKNRPKPSARSNALELPKLLPTQQQV